MSYMKAFAVSFLIVMTSTAVAGNDNQEGIMSATGTFEVSLEPQEDGEFPAGRMLISKTYSGHLNGTGIGQMISKRTESGSAIYYAIEEVEASVDGKSGSFTLQHEGEMSSEGQSLSVRIMDGSGSGELENISGDMEIIQEDGAHKYILNYKL